MQELIERLKKHGITFDAPLTVEEIEKIESFYEILFPPDLREFYMTALPVEDHFPNWRDFSADNVATIMNQLESPLEDILYDIEHNEFWMPEWGDEPSDLSAAFEICKQKVSEAPRLIPVYGHRYISSKPHERGNPIYSVYQTDIIFYGENLKEYLIKEFIDTQAKIDFAKIKYIEFWSKLVS